MSTTVDFFVGDDHSSLYAKYRPNPPPVIINEIISYVKEKFPSDLDKAVDIGCGTGQSTRVLQPHFQHVMGFDVSETQINEANQSVKKDMNLSFSVSRAESLPLVDNSIQLATVSTALHWFNMPDFFKEAFRILVPDGTLATYTYHRPIVVVDNPEHVEQVQDIFEQLNYLTVSYFGEEKRTIAQTLYKDIQFPDEFFIDFVRKESIIDKLRATFADYIGMVTTMSSVQQLKRQDPDLANKSLHDAVHSVMKIIGKENHNPSEVPVTVEYHYTLLMGRRKC